MTFTGSRLRIARERRGLTKKALAELTSLSERSVQEHESGRTVPTDEHVRAFASALRFPVTFFSQPEMEMPDPDAASFRSMKSMTAAQRDMALAAGALCVEVNRWFEQHKGFTPPSPALPDLRGAEPEAAAIELRARWKLDQRPVKNMIHRLEFYGVRVFSLVQESVEVDAFSMWKGPVPFMFLNTKKTAERSRFDAAHELGHLVLHRHGDPSGRDAEQQADEFASAFLMPSESVSIHRPKVVMRENLVVLKRHWGVSVMALVVRMHRLGLITDWQYRRLCIDLHDCRTREPNPMPRESSQILAKIFGELQKEGLSKADVARTLHLHLHDLEALVFGLAVLPSTGPAQTPGGGRKPQLRLVAKSRA